MRRSGLEESRVFGRLDFGFGARPGWSSSPRLSTKVVPASELQSPFQDPKGNSVQLKKVRSPTHRKQSQEQKEDDGETGARHLPRPDSFPVYSACFSQADAGLRMLEVFLQPKRCYHKSLTRDAKDSKLKRVHPPINGS